MLKALTFQMINYTIILKFCKNFSLPIFSPIVLDKFETLNYQFYSLVYI